MCIVPADAPRGHSDHTPPTTGQFEVASHSLGRSLVLVANPDWPQNQRPLRRPSPRAVRRIEITFSMSGEAQLAAIAAGRACTTSS
jgi:ABC-type transport system substrate-binding protein